jgi:O-antigen/teichoic acid export membrane protein
MAKYLGTEGYGVNAQINTLVSLVVPIMTMGLGYGVVRLIAGKDDQFYISSRIKSSLLSVLSLSILTSILVILLAPIINQFFIKVNWATVIIQWSTPLIVLSSLEMIIKDYFRARLHIVEYSIIQILQTISYVVAVSWLLLSGFGLLEIVWAWSIIKLVFLLISIFYLIKVGDFLFSSPLLTGQDFNNLLRFGFPIVLAGLGTWFTQLGDRWVIGYYLDIDQVGIYNASYMLASIISAIGSPFWSPLYPLMAAASNKDEYAVLTVICRRYMNAFCLLAFPSFFGLAVLSNDLLSKFGTDSFQTNPMIFIFISSAILLDQITTICYYLSFIEGLTNFLRNISIFTAIVNLLLNILLVPFFGIMGAAIATFIGYFLLDTLLIYKCKICGYSFSELYDFQSIGKLLLFSALMAIFIFIIRPLFSSMLSSIFIIIGTGGLFYCLLCLFWAKDLLLQLFQLNGQKK